MPSDPGRRWERRGSPVTPGTPPAIVNIFTLTPEEFVKLMRNAEAGGPMAFEATSGLAWDMYGGLQ